MGYTPRSQGFAETRRNDGVDDHSAAAAEFPDEATLADLPTTAPSNPTDSRDISTLLPHGRPYVERDPRRPSDTVRRILIGLAVLGVVASGGIYGYVQHDHAQQWAERATTLDADLARTRNSLVSTKKNLTRSEDDARGLQERIDVIAHDKAQVEDERELRRKEAEAFSNLSASLDDATSQLVDCHNAGVRLNDITFALLDGDESSSDPRRDYDAAMNEANQICDKARRAIAQAEALKQQLFEGS